MDKVENIELSGEKPRRRYTKWNNDIYRQVVTESTNMEYEVMGSFAGVMTKISHLHHSCGEIIEISPFKFMRGARCKKCYQTARLQKIRKTDCEFREEVKAVVGEEYVSLSVYETSFKKIKMRHSKCGTEYEVRPGSFLRGARCPFCTVNARKTDSTFKRQVNQLTRGDYVTLENYSGARRKLLFKHLSCGYEYKATPNDFLNGNRCPRCSRKSSVRSVMSAAEAKRRSHDDFEELVSREAGSSYTVVGHYRSMLTKVLMKHQECGHQWEVLPSNFIYRKGGCPRCSESRGEREVRNYLERAGFKFTAQYRTADCMDKRPLPFDFALHLEKGIVIIEYDGQHHSVPTDFAGKGDLWAARLFLQIRRRDDIKTEYCLANGIPLIRIDYTQFDEIEAILDRELSALGVTGKRSNTDNNDNTQKEDAA